MSFVLSTLNYIKRNGPVKTFYAIKERLADNKKVYRYQGIDEEERLEQVAGILNLKTRFSILVPTYETPEYFLTELVESVISQTYGRWELVIADASSTDCVKKVIDTYDDKRIRYIKLSENGGISKNSNEGLEFCEGDYVGLLDHDDVLSIDALYNMAQSIEKSEKQGKSPLVLYSDEDKFESETKQFFAPNIKPDFNLDLLLSNNYICHFLVMKKELISKLKFRCEFDGAQDYDLILRGVSELIRTYGRSFEEYIVHIPRVLYHWRSHDNSTSKNPSSKQYAYDAGKRAIEDFLKREDMDASVSESEHFGFYNVTYVPDIFSQRKDVCGVGYRVTDRHGNVCDGAYNEKKELLFEGLNRHYSGGLMHRAHCAMTVPYISVKGAKLNYEAAVVYQELLSEAGDNPDYCAISFKLCDIMRQRGFVFVYDPGKIVKDSKWLKRQLSSQITTE